MINFGSSDVFSQSPGRCNFSPRSLPYVTYGDFEPSIYDPKYKRTYYRWVFQNIPAFRTEPLMPNPVNYFARIEFWQRQQSWTEISYQYLKLYSEWLRKFKRTFSKRNLKLQLDSLTDPMEKLKFIANHIKENYTRTGYDGYLPNQYSEMFEEKKGNSGALNILLYAMLEWAGLKPHFVLVSTKSNGVVRKEIPSGSQFNYVLCRVAVKGRPYLLDVTDPKLPFDLIPTHCFNSEGFIVHETDVQWINLEPKTIEKIKASAFFR